MAAFSYLLNEHNMNQDFKYHLIEVDKYNQKKFNLKAIYKSDLHKKFIKINSLEECSA